ncbi:MAG: TolC family protein, partial [Candidatus Omnitrophica bacterium]|nr:TolC family protein [Candidatus Omnitrophota bacterium]
MKRFGICLIFFLLSACLTIQVMAEEVLTWDDCVKETKQNHPDLISAHEELNQAKANKAITGSNFLPQISSGLSGKTSKTTARVTTDTYSYDITGKQLLFDGFKTSYDIASAKENIKSAQYSYEVTSSNVRLRLRTAFVELLRVQDLLNITEDIAKRRNKNVELVKLRYEAGREHKGSLLTAQANLAQAEFEVAQAKRNSSLARRRLTKELGRMKLAPIRVKGDFEVKYSDRGRLDFERLSESTPFLQELIAKKEATRFGLKSAKADFFPEVYANASAGRTDSHWPPRKEEWSAGASLSFPIFEGGSRIAEVSKTKAALNQAQADERSGRDGVILTLEETWKELQDAMDEVEVQQKFLEAAQERAKITQAQYSTGLISF